MLKCRSTSCFSLETPRRHPATTRAHSDVLTQQAPKKALHLEPSVQHRTWVISRYPHHVFQPAIDLQRTEIRWNTSTSMKIDVPIPRRKHSNPGAWDAIGSLWTRCWSGHPAQSKKQHAHKCALVSCFFCNKESDRFGQYHLPLKIKSAGKFWQLQTLIQLTKTDWHSGSPSFSFPIFALLLFPLPSLPSLPSFPFSLPPFPPHPLSNATPDPSFPFTPFDPLLFPLLPSLLPLAFFKSFPLDAETHCALQSGAQSPFQSVQSSYPFTTSILPGTITQYQRISVTSNPCLLSKGGAWGGSGQGQQFTFWLCSCF